ncbi:MAG: T9SS C-terminal target domain-containing protein [Ignavibacteriae bacterium]|nr:MAG: T9SS C-terminal target domain-containing protein [Ignavibacteriota bacterium]
MKKYYFYLVLLVFSLSGLKEAYSQYPSFRIFPSTTIQIEPVIVRHPINHQIMFASSYNVFPQASFRSEGVYVTTNGGQTWFGNDTCTGIPRTNHGGDPGPVIDKDGRFILTHLGANFPPGMFGNYSTNFGATWSNNYTIISGDNDKGAPTTDGNPSSPFYGRTYVAWTRFVSPFPVVFSSTLNGGESWSSVKQINNSINGHQSIGASITAGSNGIIFVSWASVLTAFPFNENYIGFASSSDAGANWSVQETAIDITGIKTSSLSPWGIRVNSYPGIDVDNSGGPRNGWIYIVSTEKNHSPAGSDPDVVFFRSTNGGSSWSTGIRVNQDAMNNGKVQYFPAIRVDEHGGINIVYYDNRNISSDSVGVYFSRSTDGGNTWTDRIVSNHHFRPKAISGAGSGNQGDNISMTSGNGKLWPVWMSDYSGNYQIWTAMIDYIALGVKNISTEVPFSYNLYQNYPNPFNPNTKIKFDISSNAKREMSNVKIAIFDVRGRELTVLVNENLKPGTYETEWNASNYPSGIYFYTLHTDSYRETRKMALIK